MGLFKKTKYSLRIKRCFNCDFAHELDERLLNGEHAASGLLKCAACRKHCVVTWDRHGCLKAKRVFRNIQYFREINIERLEKWIVYLRKSLNKLRRLDKSVPAAPADPKQIQTKKGKSNDAKKQKEPVEKNPGRNDGSNKG